MSDRFDEHLSQLGAPRPLDADFRARLERALGDEAAAGATERWTFDGPRAMWRIAGQGGGWLIGLNSQRSAPPAGLTAVPIEGLRLPWELQLLWRRGDDRASVRDVVAAFLESARLTAEDVDG